MFYWLLKYVFIGPVLRLVNRPTVQGQENIPVSGPALLAGNHLSIADWLITPLMCERRISYIAKSEYFTMPGIKGKLQKFFFSASGQVPVDRTGGDAAQAALDTACSLLSKGRLVELYIEGTRSPDGRLYKGKTGLARVALQMGVPVIPVAVIGTDVVCPQGKKFRWRPARVHIKFGEPLDFSRFEGMEGNRFVVRTVTDEITYELMKMTGQEYVDIYAHTLKQGHAHGLEQGPVPATDSGSDRIPESVAG
jgi:1-acyl-sn-glycerol-3-phosphate acyltransferase